MKVFNKKVFIVLVLCIIFSESFTHAYRANFPSFGPNNMRSQNNKLKGSNSNGKIMLIDREGNHLKYAISPNKEEEILVEFPAKTAPFDVPSSQTILLEFPAKTAPFDVPSSQPILLEFPAKTAPFDASSSQP